MINPHIVGSTEWCEHERANMRKAAAPKAPKAPGPQPGYESLAAVLQRALDQAQCGKGAERHATGVPFDQQPMQSISKLVGSADGLIYQAIKKAQESQRLPEGRDIAELLGAINYLAGAIIYKEAQRAQI